MFKINLGLKKLLFTAVLVMALLLFSSFASTKIQIGSSHDFKILYKVKHTSVKNQGRTGTCWCFATLSFLESELLRIGGEEIDLSEMFIVRNVYPHKAEQYIRMHGKANFASGGQAHDVLNEIRTTGIVTECLYPGLAGDEQKHDHSEMDRVLESILDSILKGRDKISNRWRPVVNLVLDVYLGKPIEKFEYKGTVYTPVTFFKDYLKLNPDDYIELTSYNHLPFYEKTLLQIPDNWSGDLYYNIPLDDLETVMKYSLKNGYSVVWDGDISEPTFDQKKKGIAVLPDENAKNENSNSEPELEVIVDQCKRQATFENHMTTDDHLMHIVGLAKNQEGDIFYLTKNSWGTGVKNEGYIYMSTSYVRMKTIAIMIHRDALPIEIAEKLGLKEVKKETDSTTN